MKKSRPYLCCVSVTLALALSACAGSKGGGPSREFSFEAQDRDSGTPSNFNDSGSRVVPTGGDASTAKPMMNCAETSSDVRSEIVPGPVDIIWIVDSSGSMRGEARRVQENLNRFSEYLVSKSIDAHFVLITGPGFVEVPPPLGEDDEHFLRISHFVGSANALWDLPFLWNAYKHHLRENAMLHVVTVSDDESGVSADCFLSDIREKLGPGRDLRVHTFASELVGTPEADQIQRDLYENLGSCGTAQRIESGCPGSAAVGREHYKTAAMTGGAAISICTQDWSGAFDLIAKNVSESVEVTGCELSLPPIPDGSYLDLDKVSVSATGSDGSPQALQRVSGPESCSAQGWYVDDENAPSEVILCESACAAFAAEAASIDVGIQCAILLR